MILTVKNRVCTTTTQVYFLFCQLHIFAGLLNVTDQGGKNVLGDAAAVDDWFRSASAVPQDGGPGRSIRACPPSPSYSYSSAAAEGSWSHFTQWQRFLLSQLSLYEIMMRKKAAIILKCNKFTSVGSCCCWWETDFTQSWCLFRWSLHQWTLMSK